MKLIMLVSVVAVLILPSISVSKTLEVLNCKGGKVDMGDTTYSVVKKCGAPAYQETISTEGCEKVEKWHYDCLGRGYVDVLEFKAGVLTDRSRGEKSTGVQQCR